MQAYRIQICSDVDYENLIAEVYVDDRYVALVSREDPDGPFLVEYPGPDQNEAVVARKVDVDTLLTALHEACAKLGDGSKTKNQGPSAGTSDK